MTTTTMKSGSATAAVVVLLAITVAISLLAPALGTRMMEVGFPVLGLWLLVRRAPDRLDPSLAFPAICLFWFWAGSIPILPGNQSSSLLNDFDDRQWLFYLCGFTALWCGTLALQGRHVDLPQLRSLRVRWREDTALMAFLSLMLILFLAWASITRVEGIPIFKADVDVIRVEVPSRHHVAYQLEIILSNLLLPLIFVYLWTAPAPKLRRTLYASSVFIAFILISQGNRGLLLPSLLTVLALRHYLRKSLRIRQLIFVGLAVLPAISVSGYFRSLQHYGPTYALDLAEMGFPLPLQPFSNIYLYIRAPLDTFRNVVKLMPETTPFQHGYLSLGFVEQVLPGRHPSSDFFFKNLLGHTFEGFGEPASILGTFYGDFGVAGIIGGMFLTGLLSRVLYLRMFTGSTGWILVYCYFWQMLIGSLYGTLFAYVSEIILPAGWIVLVWSLTGPSLASDSKTTFWGRQFALGPDRQLER